MLAEEMFSAFLEYSYDAYFFRGTFVTIFFCMRQDWELITSVAILGRTIHRTFDRPL